jgi:hypothetical protein
MSATIESALLLVAQKSHSDWVYGTAIDDRGTSKVGRPLSRWDAVAFISVVVRSSVEASHFSAEHLHPQ